eukprot:scaffold36311_cov119-Isochrysis_galbana.AAC.1
MKSCRPSAHRASPGSTKPLACKFVRCPNRSCTAAPTASACSSPTNGCETMTSVTSDGTPCLKPSTLSWNSACALLNAVLASSTLRRCSGRRAAEPASGLSAAGGTGTATASAVRQARRSIQLKRFGGKEAI